MNIKNAQRHSQLNLPLSQLSNNQPLDLQKSSLYISNNEAYDLAVDQGFALCDQAIDEAYLKQSLLNAKCGALATFEGWVRNHNNTKPVSHLTYYGYEQLAINQGKLIIDAALKQFDIVKAIAMHRIGELAIGDMAVYIGVVSAHRKPAFEACEWLLDTIKADIPVWKQEFYTDDTPAAWLSNDG